ncbi:MAG: hypothetical protein LBF95_03265 [Treponema sp.]|jgi:predicted transposase/invertase (TIGR01784 family)|nr:hypothetical protein [Treponema sp.]
MNVEMFLSPEQCEPVRLEYYDPERRVALGGRSRIITVELEKVEKALAKSAGEMTGKERWGVFFRYVKDREKRERINEILRYEEGIAMAGEVLITISKDEVERARLMSEYKYAVDLQSRMVTARRQGKIEGERAGITKGKREGKREVARKMKDQGIPVNRIAELTGMPPDDIANL